MKAKLTVIQAGTFASIQDKGRRSFAQYGVPVSGFIDQKAARKVNKLLGNSAKAAVLEWTQIGPELQFSKPSQIVISETSPKTTLNGHPIRAQEIIHVPENSILNLGYNHHVVYTYLAIKSGFKTERILGSRSMQKGITPYGAISTNTILHYSSKKGKTPLFTKPSFDLPLPLEDKLARVIDCYPGPEYVLLDDKQKTALEGYFTLSNQRNRMGMQLNELLPNHLPSMLSAPIIPGTVQLTPSGKLIVLSKDCQTTGGYPRILHLPKKELAQLSQTIQNVRFRFNLVHYDG